MTSGDGGVLRCEAVVVYGAGTDAVEAAAVRHALRREPMPGLIVMIDVSDPDAAAALTITDDSLRSVLAAPARQIDARVVVDSRSLQGQGSAPRVVLDPRRRTCEVEGRPVELARLEFDLLAYLVANTGVVVRRRELLEQVWGTAIGSTGTISVHVRQLRRKIEVDPDRPRHLLTARGVGYRFEP